MNRYDQLAVAIASVKPRVIVEVGTWNGDRAVEMATHALRFNEKIEYHGFDLFETATKATDAAELNVKPHHSLREVTAKLRKIAKLNAGFTFKLYKGNTRQTLGPAMAKIKADFAFVDGGHSLNTIASDLAALETVPVVIADDFYSQDGEARGPDITKFGCNLAVEQGAGWKRLPQRDPVKGGGFVQMVARGWAPQVALNIKTRNCVPDEDIQRNVSYALSKNLPLVFACKPHNELAVFCSAGPSLKDNLAEIRKLAKAGRKIVCVKHAHDFLIANGVVPWACVLLDPRAHVQDFIKNPHPDVIYFVASMCHKTTIDRLIRKKAKARVYHAMVGAGESKLIKSGFLVGGGSTAATRGLGVLQLLGFRRFSLYGFDSCYRDKPNLRAKNKNGAAYVKVNVMGRDFYSDLELVAQAQDFQKFMQANSCNLNVKGDGMISHIWNHLRPKGKLSDIEHG